MHRCREKSRTGELCFKLAQGSMELHMTLPSLHISSLRGVHNGSDQGMVLDHLPGTKRANSYSLATVKMMPRRRQRLKKKKKSFSPSGFPIFLAEKFWKCHLVRISTTQSRPCRQPATLVWKGAVIPPSTHTHPLQTDSKEEIRRSQQRRTAGVCSDLHYLLTASVHRC